MRVLVVGGAGFVGRHLVRLLGAEGHAVTVLDPAEGDTAWSGNVHQVRRGGDATALLAGIMYTQDVVYLLATTSNIPATWDAPAHEIRGNLLPMLIYAQAAVDAGVGRIAMTSSGGTVYGPFEGRASEDHPAQPDTPYGVTKLAMEGFLRYLGRRFGVRTDIYRIGNVYGPGQPARTGQGVVAHWIKAIRRDEPLLMIGDPETVRDYVFVGDVAKRLTWSLRESPDDGTWNIGTGRPTSLQALLSHVTKLHGGDLEVHHVPGRDFDVPSNLLDGSRLDARFPGRPYVTIEEGLRRTWGVEFPGS